MKINYLLSTVKNKSSSSPPSPPSLLGQLFKSCETRLINFFESNFPEEMPTPRTREVLEQENQY